MRLNFSPIQQRQTLLYAVLLQYAAELQSHSSIAKYMYLTNVYVFTISSILLSLASTCHSSSGKCVYIVKLHS